MKTDKIFDKYLNLLIKTTRNYINSTRQWEDNEYVVKFHYVETKKNIAILSATHKSVFGKINEKIKRDGCIKEIVHYSLEVDVVIDLIDFVVINENEIGATYPNEGKQLPYDIMK